MKLELEIYGCLCSTKIFRINGIEADTDDFGEKYDDDPSDAPEYGCGNMQFHPYSPDPQVMKKYHINTQEWDEICDKLADGLSFGYCGWCI